MKSLELLKKRPMGPKENEIHITMAEFLVSFNKNMPSSFPKVTEAQLIKFKESHASFFKGKDKWSLDQHRKKVIDWLPQNVGVL